MENVAHAVTHIQEKSLLSLHFFHKCESCKTCLIALFLVWLEYVKPNTDCFTLEVFKV